MTAQVIRKLSQHTRDPAVRADLLWFVSLLDLAGGQFSEATRTLLLPMLLSAASILACGATLSMW